ncbi:precorrin-2 C(20)-methyltransferase [Hyphomicrobiales bacterium 4NK60-0047b]
MSDAVIQGSANAKATENPKGQLFGLGVGPGDPELVTMKAVKLLAQSDVVAFPTAKASGGNARKTVEPYITENHELLPLIYPVTAGPVADTSAYLPLMNKFYDETAEEIAKILDKGKNVSIICAGDPFVFGSYMYWHARLSTRYDVTVVPGISSILAAPVQLGMPLCHREDPVSILPATLSEEELVERLTQCGSAVIMKLGRTFPKVVRALEKANMIDNAYYVERATMEKERIFPVKDVNPNDVAYFSVIVIPCEKPV